jgi:RimJ/RimL family protein N-acetyltransferase
MPSLVDKVLPAGFLRSRQQPVLSLEDLVMRPWDLSDGDAVVRAYSDPDVQRWHRQSLTSAEAGDWIRDRQDRWGRESGADWAITRSQRVVGRIGVHSIDPRQGQAEISYWVMPEARGHRIAPRALDTLASWAADAGLHRLELMHSVENPASCRVAELSAFELEGIKRQQHRHADGWHDMHLHARLISGS